MRMSAKENIQNCSSFPKESPELLTPKKERKTRSVSFDATVEMLKDVSLTNEGDAAVTTEELPSTPRPRRGRRGRMSKQKSDISAMLEPSSPMASPAPSTPDAFLAGRSPQGRRRLHVRQSSDLSGMFELGPPPLCSSDSFDRSQRILKGDTTDDTNNVPMLKIKGRNIKGPIFAARAS